jgi:IS30 family transposase
MSHYTQLTQEQRYQIYAFMKAGFSQKETAHEIGVHPSTVSREIRRNRGQKGYRPGQAQLKTVERRLQRSRPRISLEAWNLIDSLILKDWSPEQISGRLFLEQGFSISHEWIYLHIYRDQQQGGSLYKHLRCQKKRRKRYGIQDRRGRIPDRVGIEKRPLIVERKSRIGDWEGDTLIGKAHRGVVASLVERKTKFTVLTQSKTKQAKAVRQSIERGLAPYKQRVHTITYDNGLEFTEHKKMAQFLSAKIYFAHPYAAWERGLNENTNGLIRQYLPKSKRLENLTQNQLQWIMHRLNQRPRKSLGYKTPYELFFNQNTLLTIALAG